MFQIQKSKEIHKVITFATSLLVSLQGISLQECVSFLPGFSPTDKFFFLEICFWSLLSEVFVHLESYCYIFLKPVR